MKRIIIALILSYIIFKSYIIGYEFFIDMKPGDKFHAEPGAIAVIILWLVMFGNKSTDSRGAEGGFGDSSGSCGGDSGGDGD